MENVFDLFVARRNLRKKLSPGTVDLYRQTILRLARYFQKDLDRVTAKDMTKYLSLRQTQVKDSTSFCEYTRIKTLFHTFYEIGIVPEDIFATIPQRGTPTYTEQRAYPLGELRRDCLKGCISPRQDLLIETLSSLGCRISEVCYLRWDKLDTRTETLQVGVDTDQHQAGTKTGMRYVELSEKYIAVLEKHDALRVNRSNPWFFPSQTHPDTHIMPPAMQYIFRGIRDRIGRPDIKSHAFKRSVVTYFGQNGGDLTTISAQVGTSSPVLLKHYLKTDPVAKKKLAQTLDLIDD